MKSELLYHQLAEYYDLIYADKDYQAEAEYIYKYIDKIRTDNLANNSGKVNFNLLLDLACGTGNHIKHLKKYFKCSGMDKSKEMLEIAKQKNPECSFLLQDMERFIPGQFDVIISMFSSIAYVQTYDNFRDVAKQLSNSLTDGGIVILQSWYESGEFNPGIPFIKKISDNIIRMASATVEGICSVMEYHYLIFENGRIKHLTDKHTMALFSIEKLIEILSEAGIESKYIASKKSDRGLIIGTKTRKE